MELKIASFNCENLFERAKALNISDNTAGDVILNDIAEFQKELEKTTYNKDTLLSKYKKVKDYVTVSEERGKLFKRRGFGIVGIKANGKGDWEGSILFKKARFSETSRKNTAKVVKELKADILGTIEIENRPVLNNFNGSLLNYRYPYTMAIDGNDRRGIDVGVMSKYPFKEIYSHIYDKNNNNKKIFSRDCLEIVFDINGTDIVLLINHLKSKGYGSTVKNDARRKLQADRIREIIEDKYNLEVDNVVVLGDLNDNPVRNPLNHLLNTPNLYDVLDVGSVNANQRWTYHFRGKFDQIDYILVSKPLKEKLVSSGVERRGMFGLKELTNGAEKSYSSVTHPSNAGSDHGAVWAKFDI